MAFSIQRETSDGTLSTIDLAIEYIDQADITVYVDDVLIEPTGGVTPYTWEWLTPTSLKITPDVPVGLVAMVRRGTHNAAMYHDFNAGAVFKDETMDENFLQLLYLVQEAKEGSGATDFYADLDMHGYTIRNHGAAVQDSDVVTFGQYRNDSLGSGFNRVAAEAARDVAVAAKDIVVASVAAATLSETNAAASELSAGNSASSANANRILAEQAAVVAAGSLDEFTDIYLGPKPTDPTLDNDSAALLEGALYWNTVAKEMRVYDGTAWSVTYLPVGAYVTEAELANATDPAKGAGMVGRSVLAVDSVLALISLPAAQRRTDQRFIVKGYHQGRDTGGGEFYWDSGRAKTGHDGGAVIDPSVPWDGSQAGLPGFLAGTGGASGNGCFVRILGDFVSPEMFGAVGDMVADDYAALQACADSVSLTGKILFTGTYSSTNTICVVGNNIHIEGTARSLLKRANYSTVATASHPKGCVLLVGDDITRYTNAVIVGVNIDGNATNQNIYTDSQHARGIYIVRYDGVRVEGCRVNNNPMVGISFRFSNGLSVCNNEASYNGVTVSGAADRNGISLGTAGSSTAVVEPLENATAIGNRCIGNYDTGIMFGWFRRVIISNNIIKGIGTWGWGVEGTPAGAVMPTTTSYIGDICISGNVIEGTRIGIFVSSSKAGNCIVSGNTLRNVASSNIMLAAGAGGSIVASGNIMENAFHNNQDNTYHAIYLDADSVIFKDNILNFPEAETPVLGYAVSARGADISIHDNKLHNPHNGIQVNYYASGVMATAQYSLSIVGNSLYKPRTNQVNGLIDVVFSSGMAGKIVRFIEISCNTMSSRKSGNVLRLNMSQADCLLKNVRVVDNVYQDDLYTGDDRATTALSVLPPPTIPIESLLVRGNSFKDTRYIAMPTLSGSVSMIDRSNNIELPGFRAKGTTAQRPSLTSADQKYIYFDTTLGKQVWWTGTEWKDAAGTTV